MTAAETTGQEAAAGRTRGRAETRRRLMDAAHDVFAEHGIRDARIELICDRAGFTRGAFYSNFASKEDLFLALYEEQMREQCTRLQEVIEDVLARNAASGWSSLRETVTRISTLFMQPLAPNQQWYLLVSEFRVHAVRRPEVRRHAEAAQRRFFEEVGDILAGLLERLGIALRVSPYDAVSVLAAMYEKALEQALFEGVDATTDSKLITEVLPEMVLSLVEQ